MSPSPRPRHSLAANSQRDLATLQAPSAALLTRWKPVQAPSMCHGEDTAEAAQCAEHAPSERRILRLLLLLASLLRRHVLLVLELGDLAKHDGGVAVEEGNARQALAVLEGVDHERLLRHEDDLGHLVRLERVRV